MNNDELLTQDELNKLKINENVSLQQDVRNIIILAKNELNTIDSNIDGYNDKVLKKVKKKLNSLLLKVASLRK